MNIKEELIKWHQTKGLKAAFDICRELYNRIKEEDMSIDEQAREEYARKHPVENEESA